MKFNELPIASTTLQDVRKTFMKFRYQLIQKFRKTLDNSSKFPFGECFSTSAIFFRKLDHSNKFKEFPKNMLIHKSSVNFQEL